MYEILLKYYPLSLLSSIYVKLETVTKWLLDGKMICHSIVGAHRILPTCADVQYRIFIRNNDWLLSSRFPLILLHFLLFTN